MKSLRTTDMDRIFTLDDLMSMGEAVMSIGEIPAPPVSGNDKDWEWPSESEKDAHWWNVTEGA